MKNAFIFSASVIGLALAAGGAYFLGVETVAQTPVFNPAPNPYANGIYANGIVESDQQYGANINLYPDVSGTIRQVLVKEGDHVKAGMPLLIVDDTVQRGATGQQQAQAESALAVLQQLKAQPRKETLAVAKAQRNLADANLATASDQFEKQKRSFDIDPRSVSMDTLDNARDARNAAKANQEVAQKQYELTLRGAWRYDIVNQQRQYEASSKAAESARALLDRYTIKAPVDGVVLMLNTAIGSYVSPQGVYNTYTQLATPLIVMGGEQSTLNVRCYIDEILISRLPAADRIGAQMYIRGTDTKVPLEFVRIQPYVTPKISLSDQRQERVDLRVLPIIFRFRNNAGMKLYPGQLVDVYVGQK